VKHFSEVYLPEREHKSLIGSGGDPSKSSIKIIDQKNPSKSSNKIIDQDHRVSGIQEFHLPECTSARRVSFFSSFLMKEPFFVKESCLVPRQGWVRSKSSINIIGRVVFVPCLMSGGVHHCAPCFCLFFFLGETAFLGTSSRICGINIIVEGPGEWYSRHVLLSGECTSTTAQRNSRTQLKVPSLDTPRSSLFYTLQWGGYGY